MQENDQFALKICSLQPATECSLTTEIITITEFHCKYPTKLEFQFAMQFTCYFIEKFQISTDIF